MSYHPHFNDSESVVVLPKKWRDTPDGAKGVRTWPSGTPGILDGNNLWTNVNNHTDQIVSTLTTGTPPFVVASTTEISNLNSALLQGKGVGTLGNTVPLLDGANNWSANQLLAGSNEQQFRATDQRVWSRATGVLGFDANSRLEFSVGTTLMWNILSGGNLLPGTDGTRDLGGASKRAKDIHYSGQMKSTISTGTAPFTVLSQTIVANLNATAVGSLETTAFVLVNGTQGLSASWDAGNFEIRAQTFNSDVTTGTAPFTVASTTVVANLNVTSVGGVSDPASLSTANTWSANQLISSSNEIQFNAPTESISSPVTSWVRLDSAGAIQLRIGGVQKAFLIVSGMTFADTCTANKFVSTVADGTVPFASTSTTLCTNLNAAKVGGKTAAELNPATTKGDLVGFSTVEARIPIGPNNKALIADSTQALGLKWGNVTASSPVFATTTEVFSGTSPTSMTNLDLSATIGSNAAVVALAFRSAGDMNSISVRTDGDANDYVDVSGDANAYGCQLGHHDNSGDLVLIVAASSSGIIEWITESAQTCTVDILWYIK